MSSMRKYISFFLILVLPYVPPVGPVHQAFADETAASTVPIAFIKTNRNRPIPISRLEIVPEDAGLRGAELAVADNNTTGQFTGQSFQLKRYDLGSIDEASALVAQLKRDHIGFVLTDADASTLLALADAARNLPMLFFNLDASEMRLRQEDCRANIIHITPSQAMRTDALAQFLVSKKWTRWFLISGKNDADEAYADALRGSAKKFGGRIVEEKHYAYGASAARTDSGHAQVQKQMAVFTQIRAKHDVIIVADKSEVFGPYMPLRSWSPRPVAGTSGAVAVSWHPAHEQWGATQIQNRFFKHAARLMRELDYHGWLAGRAIGEAATRSASTEMKAIREYLLSSRFGVAAFKGQKLSIRSWNRQMRQPVAIANAQLPVSWSPQPGFLHQHTAVDTLGVDEAESRCQLK